MQHKFIPTILLIILFPQHNLNSSVCASREIISDYNVRNEVYEGFVYLYNFQFNKADSLLVQLEKYYHYSPWTYLYEANLYWWKIISGENTEENITNFYKALNTAKIKMKNIVTYEYQFLRIVIYSYMSRLDLMQGKYFNTLVELKKNLPVIKNTLGKESSFSGFYLTSGLYLYLTDVAYNNYLYLRPLLLFVPSGNKEKGLLFLKTKHDDIILDTESAYFLMKIYDEVEGDAKVSLHYAEKLSKAFPMNYIFREHYYRMICKKENRKLTKDEISDFREEQLKNKQLSRKQTQYFYCILQRLQTKPS